MQIPILFVELFDVTLRGLRDLYGHKRTLVCSQWDQSRQTRVSPKSQTHTVWVGLGLCVHVCVCVYVCVSLRAGVSVCVCVCVV